jgi:hypothetical protein
MSFSNNILHLGVSKKVSKIMDAGSKTGEYFGKK